MAKSASSIQTLYDLEKEIYKLQLKSKDIELRLDDSFDHLQDNFYKMSWNSIFRFKRSSRRRQQQEEGNYSSGFLQGLLGSESIQYALEQLIPILANKISTGLERLIDRWFRKK